jgi:hypothetical protein
MLQFTERNVIEGLSSLPQSTHFLQCRNVQRIVQSEGVIQSNAGPIRPRPHKHHSRYGDDVCIARRQTGQPPRVWCDLGNSSQSEI